MPPSSRGRIVDAVLQLIQDERRADFTFDEVARAAGVSRQTVHANFSGRGELLVAAVERARDQAGAPALAQAVYESATALDALDALVELHAIFTPAVMRAALAVDLERLRNPDVEKFFVARPAGRHQLVRHVVNRLNAEGLLDPTWSVDAATDLVTALLSPSAAAELLEQRHWSVDDLRRHTAVALDALLLHEPSRTSVANKGERA